MLKPLLSKALELVTTLFSARSIKRDQELADAKKTLDQVEARNAAEADAAGQSDADVARRLRDKWTR